MEKRSSASELLGKAASSIGMAKQSEELLANAKTVKGVLIMAFKELLESKEPTAQVKIGTIDGTSYDRSETTDGILALEGDMRCEEGCPYFKPLSPRNRKPPVGYCTFYQTRLFKYDFLPGYTACSAYFDASNGVEDE